jgi:hypothetical protein
MGLAIVSGLVAPLAKPGDGEVVIVILVSARDPTVFAISARAPRGSHRRCSLVISARARRTADWAGITARQRGDEAGHDRVAVAVKLTQVDRPRGAAGRAADRNEPVHRAPAPRRTSARTARASSGLGSRSRRRLGPRRPRGLGHRSRVWPRPQRRLAVPLKMVLSMEGVEYR